MNESKIEREVGDLSRKIDSLTHISVEGFSESRDDSNKLNATVQVLVQRINELERRQDKLNGLDHGDRIGKLERKSDVLDERTKENKRFITWLTGLIITTLIAFAIESVWHWIDWTSKGKERGQTTGTESVTTNR